MRVGKEDYHLLKAGTDLHRIHAQLFGSSQFNDSEKGHARFSPIRDGSGAVIPTLYAAQSFECATCEIILRCPDTPPRARMTMAPPDIVHPSDYRQHAHSHLRTMHDLNLVSLTATAQRKIGLPGNGLLAGPRSTYPVTRNWAAHIHVHCTSA
ncbi:RES domain-containing protein [Sphingobium sp. AP50]|uniref:RES domain-containing protein n=1 Tax=Sphingobium sp. AP50 TaxID=1884369 RepID=UPI002108E52C|nr:RES domain-containing protein [Sphingobium sp. AP50]